MAKEPEETVVREEQPKRIENEKDKPVRVHQGRNSQ